MAGQRGKPGVIDGLSQEFFFDGPSTLTSPTTVLSGVRSGVQGTELATRASFQEARRGNELAEDSLRLQAAAAFHQDERLRQVRDGLEEGFEMVADGIDRNTTEVGAVRLSVDRVADGIDNTGVIVHRMGETFRIWQKEASDQRGVLIEQGQHAVDIGELALRQRSLQADLARVGLGRLDEIVGLNLKQVGIQERGLDSMRDQLRVLQRLKREADHARMIGRSHIALTRAGTNAMSRAAISIDELVRRESDAEITRKSISERISHAARFAAMQVELLERAEQRDRAKLAAIQKLARNGQLSNGHLERILNSQLRIEDIEKSQIHELQGIADGVYGLQGINLDILDELVEGNRAAREFYDQVTAQLDQAHEEVIVGLQGLGHEISNTVRDEINRIIKVAERTEELSRNGQRNLADEQLRIATTLADAGKIERAMEFFAKAEEIFPIDYRIYFQRAILKIALDDADGAKKDLEDALAMCSDNQQARARIRANIARLLFSEAKILMANGKYREAEELIWESIKQMREAKEEDAGIYLDFEELESLISLRKREFEEERLRLLGVRYDRMLDNLSNENVEAALDEFENLVVLETVWLAAVEDLSDIAGKHSQLFTQRLEDIASETMTGRPVESLYSLLSIMLIVGGGAVTTLRAILDHAKEKEGECDADLERTVCEAEEAAALEKRNKEIADYNTACNQAIADFHQFCLEGRTEKASKQLESMIMERAEWMCCNRVWEREEIVENRAIVAEIMQRLVNKPPYIVKAVPENFSWYFLNLAMRLGDLSRSQTYRLFARIAEHNRLETALMTQISLPSILREKLGNKEKELRRIVVLKDPIDFPNIVRLFSSYDI